MLCFGHYKAFSLMNSQLLSHWIKTVKFPAWMGEGHMRPYTLAEELLVVNDGLGRKGHFVKDVATGKLPEGQ